MRSGESALKILHLRWSTMFCFLYTSALQVYIFHLLFPLLALRVPVSTVLLPFTLPPTSSPTHIFHMSNLFLSQNIAQKDPLKNIPSTAANATSLSANLFSDPIHRNAQSALALTAGISVCALNSFLFVALSLIKVSINKLYISCSTVTKVWRGKRKRSGEDKAMQCTSHLNRCTSH